MYKILIVEDEPHLRLLYERELSEEGYHVECVATGEEALRTLEDAPFDLVVLDIRLKEPASDGLALLDEIVRTRRKQKVILNTAYTSYMDEGVSWLADGYVVKSADLTELKDTIRTVMAQA